MYFLSKCAQASWANTRLLTQKLEQVLLNSENSVSQFMPQNPLWMLEELSHAQIPVRKVKHFPVAA